MEDRINEATQALKKAILEEMSKLTKQLDERQRVINEVADIIHNIPRMKCDKEERQVETAWKILDKNRR